MAGRQLLFDIEADRLELGDVSKIHCLAVLDRESGEEWAFGPDHILDGVALLAQAGLVIGHNIVEYDVPVLQKFYPAFAPLAMLDTLCSSRTAYAGNDSPMHRFDRKRWAQGKISDPDLMKKPHSLKAWGERLGERKMPQPEDFSEFTEPMLAYCVQDVRVTKRVLDWLIPERLPEGSALLETLAAQILRAQRLHGVAFNEAGAHELLAELLDERAELTARLRALYPPWLARDGKLATPKRTQVSRKVAPGEIGYRNVRQGCPYQKVKLVEFNPGSGQHIARLLKARHNWKPKEFTDGGQPKVTDQILQDLPYPEAPDLARYKSIDKIVGFLAGGDNAWLELVRDGRIHGYTKHLGTVTHRGSHARPNLGQVPSRHVLGDRCRALFIATPGLKLVGVDAQGLQLRVLAHYLGAYDGGAFAKVCEESDVHVYFQEMTGLFTRLWQKQYTYSWFFGAGPYKRGLYVLKDFQDARRLGLTTKAMPALSAATRLGKETQAKLMDNIEGMHTLNRHLRATYRRGWLRTLDGRKVQVLSQHRALNTLLMAGEAVLVKHAMVKVADMGLPARQVLWVHDELQFEVAPEDADAVGAAVVQAFEETGRDFNLRVRLEAGAAVGDTWQETH